MNKQESDILYSLYNKRYVNQRILSEETGHSLGVVNRSIKNLINEKYLSDNIELTKKAYDEFEEKKPCNAVILAAGFGMRMVPINKDIPKALLEVDGETLIERIIKQLHEVNINDITIVVGYLKDKFEYLIDSYGVKLVYNKNYAIKNNISSLNLVNKNISNTYIIPCDVWCEYNPFKENEMYSWYMVSDEIDDESEVRINRKMELVKTQHNQGGNAMIGISYLTKDVAKIICDKLKIYDKDSNYDNEFWEKTLYNEDRMIVQAKVVHASEVVEINTYEQLRDLDSESRHLKSTAVKVIARQLNVDENEIINFEILKKGMTNRSFMFDCKDNKYIMRIPGEGTDKLINRGQEADVYDAIKGFGLCDDPIYINRDNGYKITKFLKGVRNCDPFSEDDVIKSMLKLKEFHDLNIKVNHEFKIFDKIDEYEKLWNGEPSIYRDYYETKKNIFKLRSFVEANISQWSLTHIDAVPDNFLFFDDNGIEKIQLTDWEYAGMQDPHLDLAMFSVYSFYDKNQIDKLIDIYFGDGNCDVKTRIKIYCYVSISGLLWSNWCEYKRNLGVEFGEYSLKQYRYAKDFYKIAANEIEKL